MVDTLIDAKARGDLRQEVDSIKQDLRHLRGDIADLARTLMETSWGAADVNKARAALQAQAQQRIEQLRSAVKAGRECGAQALDQTRQQVQQHPLIALAGALAAGFLLGRLLHRNINA